MEVINNLVALVHQNADSVLQYLKFLGLLIFGFLLIGSLFRFIFGKKAQLNLAVSSAVEILCLYVINVVIFALGLHYDFFLSPLPFVEMNGEYLTIFPILSSEFTDICSQILKILIVAFMVNIFNDVIPQGKHLISWYFFRIITVVLAVGANYIVDVLLALILPQGLAEIAPTVLMISLIVLVLLGSLKFIVGVALAFFDPIISALYTFFFSNFIGRELAKAMVTTALLTALVVLLNCLEITVIHIAASALSAYIPLLLVILVLWYVIGHIL